MNRLLSRVALRAALLPALALSLALGGCDSSDPAPAAGAFSARVTGGQTLTLAGEAGFAVGTEDGERYFAVGLVGDPDANKTVVLIARGTPARRTYTLTLDEEAGEAGAIFAVQTGEDEGALYGADAGTLTVTDVAGDRLRGRFEFHAVNLFDETDAVTVTGTFDARQGEVDTPETPTARPAQAAR